jgi:serine/threonine-protein kinase
MGEFYDDLVRVGDGLPALAMADGTGAYSTRRTAPTVGGVTAPPTSGGSKTGLIVAVVGGVLLLGAGGGVFMAMSTPEPVAETPPVAVIPQLPAVTPPPEPEVVEAPPPVEEEFLIAITSDPEGAAVWRGNELIGTTPLSLPRPSGDERLDLQLRLDGHDDKDFAISSLTRAESISFTLDQTRRSSGRRSSSSSSSSSSGSSSASSGSDSPPPMQTSMRPSGSEVLDPWAN